jgi:LytS/YehU family sensor histidine kinase
MGWQRVTGDRGLTPFAVPAAVAVIVAIVAVITNIYEMFFALRGWESERLRAARADAARLSVEMDRLVREVDPHFLFNNLHALTHLVERGSPKALSFIQALGDTYRYVLAARHRPLVTLKEEMEALQRQCELAAARYGNGIALDVSVRLEAAERLRLPPVTLAELLTNALKHNAVSAELPLTLRVELQGDVLMVSNRMSVPVTRPPSSGVGLANLADRHRLATGHEVTWGLEAGHFVVRLPLQGH